MAIKLENKTNVEAPAGNYPYGNIIDDPGDGSGTPVDKSVYADFHQFFARLAAWAGITFNGLPENSADGFQYHEALLKSKLYYVYTALITQAGVGAPTVKVLENTLSGAIVWTYSDVGFYIGTLSGAFTADKTTGDISPNIHKFGKCARLSNDAVGVNTSDDAGVLQNGNLTDAYIEIRVYRTYP